MKTKNYFYLLMMLFMCLAINTSCGGDDDEDTPSIDTTPITVYPGTEKVIAGADTIDSSSKFVAYGKGNTVTAWHVGEANLVVNGGTRIPITVKPKYTLYDGPVCEWGCTQTNVRSKQKQGTVDESRTSATRLVWTNAGAASLMAYTFENGKLKSAGVAISTNYAETYVSYLLERFIMAPFYSGDDAYFVGIDNTELETANTISVTKVYSAQYLMNVYMPAASYTRSSADYEEQVKKMKETFDSILK